MFEIGYCGIFIVCGWSVLVDLLGKPYRCIYVPMGGGSFDCATPSMTQGSQSLPSIHAVVLYNKSQRYWRLILTFRPVGVVSLIKVLLLEQAFACLFPVAESITWRSTSNCEMNAGGKYLELTRGNTEIVLETLLTTIQIIEGFLGFLSCTVVDGVITETNLDRLNR